MRFMPGAFTPKGSCPRIYWDSQVWPAADRNGAILVCRARGLTRFEMGTANHESKFRGAQSAKCKVSTRSATRIKQPLDGDEYGGSAKPELVAADDVVAGRGASDDDPRHVRLLVAIVQPR